MGEFPNTETQFKAGNSGRPKGSKNRKTIIDNFIKNASLSTVNKRLAAALDGMPDHSKPQTIEEQVVAALVLEALQGNITAIQEILNSSYGKIVDKSETNLNMTTMGSVIRNGKELEFNIGKPPLGKREQLEDKNE